MRKEYKEALDMVQAQVEIETDTLAVVSNVTAILMEKIKDLNWVGFYFLKEGELVLGPFQGRVACNRISLNQGVCGSAFSKRKVEIVDNVHEFPGHIACDFRSKSEMVLPILCGETIYGVLDMDSPSLGRFGQEELVLAKKVLYLTKNLSWEELVR